jgi:hypothetical protein
MLWKNLGKNIIPKIKCFILNRIYPDEEVELKAEGDYVIWKDVSHNFRVVEDSVCLTIRWPSV